MDQIDPKVFKIGPVKGREARESGLWLKAWVAPTWLMAVCDLMFASGAGGGCGHPGTQPEASDLEVESNLNNIYAALIGSFTHCMDSEFQNTVA